MFGLEFIFGNEQSRCRAQGSGLTISSGFQNKLVVLNIIVDGSKKLGLITLKYFENITTKRQSIELMSACIFCCDRHRKRTFFCAVRFSFEFGNREIASQNQHNNCYENPHNTTPLIIQSPSLHTSLISRKEWLYYG